MGMKASTIYASENTMVTIPHARTARVGRRSTVVGHSGSSHSGWLCESKYSRSESAEHPVTAPEMQRVVKASMMRVNWVHFEILRYLAARRSSVV